MGRARAPKRGPVARLLQACHKGSGKHQAIRAAIRTMAARNEARTARGEGREGRRRRAFRPRPSGSIAAIAISHWWRRAALVASVVAAWVAGGGERAAEAYPQWQLAAGAIRCSQCHYAPAGGGLLTSYGRDAAGELATFGGNGAFLHGVPLPPRVAFGGDFRGALVAEEVQDPRGTTVAAFPMQADLIARVALPAGFSILATGGLRGRVRDPDDPFPNDSLHPVSTSLLVSREHWAMWQPETLGPYVRAGRFFAPFGLRMAEHILYVRRDLGFNQLQETYNVSGGWIYDRWELHLSLFAPDFVRHMGSEESGASVYGEVRVLDDRLSAAGQMRLASGPGATRFIFGAIGKFYLEPLRTLLFAEANGVQWFFDGATAQNRLQAVGAAGVSVTAVPGGLFTLLGERNQVDTALDDGWTAATLLLSWFPYAHCEAAVLGRLQMPTGGPTAKTFLFQLHYFL